MDQSAKDQIRTRFRGLRSSMSPMERQEAALQFAAAVREPLAAVFEPAAGSGSRAAAGSGIGSGSDSGSRAAAGSGIGSGSDSGSRAAAGPGRDTVAAYLSIGDEPGTHPLLLELTEEGYDVVVPVCERGYQLSWCQWTPDVELVPSARSWVLEPVGQRHQWNDLEDVGLILVPALVLDGDGNRMGQGGGYYDRFLAGVYAAAQPTAPGPATPNTTPSVRTGRPATVGMVYDHELLPPGSFDHSPHDMPLDGVLTPSRFSWFPA